MLHVFIFPVKFDVAHFCVSFVVSPFIFFSINYLLIVTHFVASSFVLSCFVSKIAVTINYVQIIETHARAIAISVVYIQHLLFY